MNKIVLVGCGNVGMSYAYSLINSSVHIDELVLIDINKEKAEGEALDLMHACSALNKKIKIKAGKYSDCKNANIVCICAGRNQNPGETRLDLINKNYAVFKSVVEEINKTKFDGIYLVATNPLDVMTSITESLSKFPKNRVIGSGTTLDTARLRNMLSLELEINPKNIHAYVIGEHGDSEFIPWSNAVIGLNKATDYLTSDKRKEILEDVRNSAYEIINKKGNTCYGIGVCLTNITKAILENSQSIFTVSCDDEENDVYIGLPAIIGKNGVEKVLHLKLTAPENKLLQTSIKVIKDSLKTCNSSFTAILKAWNVCLAGCDELLRTFAGRADLITSTSSKVVSIDFTLLT